MLIDELITKREMLRKLIKKVEAKPRQTDGKLRITKSNGAAQFRYIEPGGRERYLHADELDLARGIVQCNYDDQILRAAERQLAAVEKTIEVLGSNDLCDIYCNMHPARREMITPYVEPEEDYVRNWLEVPYQTRGFKEGEAVYVNAFGERVHSKSECLISEKLRRFDVPYRYEFPIMLKGLGVVYPDFYALNKRTREEFLFEHLGMMDNQDYIAAISAKFDAYERNGFFLGKNLLVSWETAKYPLDLNKIEQMIRTYLL